MKVAAGFGVFVALALVQVTWAPRLEAGGAFPNLVLLAVVGLTRSRGARQGLAWACVGGLLLDLLSAGAVGIHAVALLAAAYLAGLLPRREWQGGPLDLAVSAALATAVYSAILVMAGGGNGLARPDVALAARQTLAAALYNAVLAPLAGLAIRRRERARREPAPSLGTISRRAQAR